MKILKCEICLVQATCTKLCVDFAFQMMQIDNELKKNKRFVYSKGGTRKKRIKTMHLKHYNTLIKKWNKGNAIRESIWDRQFVKLGLSRSSTTSSGGPSSPSVSSSSIVKKMGVSEYIEKFYLEKRKQFDVETAIRLKADHIIVRKGQRHWLKKSRKH